MCAGVGQPGLTLVIPDWIAEDILNATAEALESAGVLLARLVCTGRRPPRLLVRRARWVDKAHYSLRTSSQMLIASEGYVPFLSEAADDKSIPVWFHTHPGQNASPAPSRLDDVVDSELSSVFRVRSGCEHYFSAIFSSSEDRLAFSGFQESVDGTRRPLSSAWIVGDRLSLIPALGTSYHSVDSMFDRSVRALGAATQETLGQLTIGIAGCGGTGSAVAEQLCRLGVRSFVLVDPDTVSASNLTRVYGSSPGSLGLSKAEVASQNLQRIAPDCETQTVSAAITDRNAATQLAHCDVVFGCTDDNAGRLVLSRLSSFLLTPVIDCGVLISATADGAVSGIDGRVTTLVPGQACLVCRGRIDMRMAAADFLTPGERKRRADEGYAPEIPHAEPSVVPFTSAVAAAAVSELLERLVGFGPAPRPSELLIRFHEREMSTNQQIPVPDHYCARDSTTLGAGLSEPFLGLTWAN